MKLKLFLYLLCAAMTLMLVGCGNAKEELESQPEAADTTVPEDETETEAEDTTAETKQTTKPATETTAASETTADTETSAVTETTEESQTETETAAEEPEVTETEPQAVETDPIVEETTEAPPAATEPPTTPAVQFTAEDLEFQCNGVSLTVGQDAAGFVAAVPADTVESAPSCYGDGSDINYYYSNFTLYIWDSNGTQLTYGIDITGTGLTTSKGIGIGSSLADVTAAYGSGYTVEGTDYVYKVDNSNLRFTISGDAVVYISYNYNL